jgi:serine/threonine kinase 32
VGYEDVKRHPWFASIDWVALENKELVSPFIPDVRRPAGDPSVAH